MSDLVGRGSADLILGMEPLESLRYLGYLKPEGVLVTASDPVRNIPSYPDPEGLYASIRSLPRHGLVPAETLDRQAGSVKVANMVMVGAAARYLPVSARSLLAADEELFARKGERVVEANRKAFRAGQGATAGR